jgi:hypothetical protein
VSLAATTAEVTSIERGTARRARDTRWLTGVVYLVGVVLHDLGVYFFGVVGVGVGISRGGNSRPSPVA